MPISILRSKVLLLVVLYTSFISCLGEKIENTISDQEGPIVEVFTDYDEAASLPLQYIEDNIRFTALSSDQQEAFFDRFDQVVVDGQYIIVREVSYSMDDNLFIFDRKGELIEKIYGSMDRGPGSFPTAMDLLYDKNGPAVEILERLEKKIVKIDLQDFSSEEIPLKLQNPMAFVRTDNFYFLYSNGVGSHTSLNDHHISKFSRDGRFIEAFFKMDSRFTDLHFPYLLESGQRENEFWYKPMLNDTVYHFNSQEDFRADVVLSSNAEISNEEAKRQIGTLAEENPRSAFEFYENNARNMPHPNSIFTLKEQSRIFIQCYRDLVSWTILAEGGNYQNILFNRVQALGFTKYLTLPDYCDGQYFYVLVPAQLLMEADEYVKKNRNEFLEVFEKEYPLSYREYLKIIEKISESSNDILIQYQLSI